MGALFGWWPVRDLAHPSGWLRLLPHDDHRELHWRWWQWLFGDGYVLVALAFVLGASTVLLHRRKTRAAS